VARGILRSEQRIESSHSSVWTGLFRKFRQLAALIILYLVLPRQALYYFEFHAINEC
jgi:hypothetical protein